MAEKKEKLIKLQFMGSSPHIIPNHGLLLPETIISVNEEEAKFLLKGLFKKV
jgi:hypothetical protein